MNRFARYWQGAAMLLVLILVAAACVPAPPATQAAATSPAATTVSPTEAATSAPAATTAATAQATTAATEAAPTAAASPTVAATSAATATSGGAATGINEVTFTATEFQYEAPATIPAGWTRFNLDNQGEQGHDLTVLKIQAGKTITDVLGALQSEGPPEWVEMYGSVSSGPGESHSYVVNIPAGDYVALSFGQSEDGPPDAAQGMVHAFTATGEGAELALEELPEADVTVNMIDYAFVITGTMTAGDQTVRVMNTGKMLHEMQVFRLNEGFTFAEFQEMLDQEPDEGQEPPFAYVGGPVMSPGVDGFIDMTLEPGAHVLVCFIPSPEHDGQPHYKLGMILQVDVK